MRRLDNVVPQPLGGTDGADLPFWSADGRSIGFFASGKLKRIDVEGGSPQILSDAPLPRGGSWNAAGTIIYAPSSGPLYLIAASGGQAAPLTEIHEGFTFHRFPHFLFQIVVQPFPNPTSKWQVSIHGGDYPRWSADGKELYFLAPDGALMASAIRDTAGSFDAATPVPLFQTRLRASGAESIGKAEYAVSPDGRFLINQPVEDATSTPITLILNWKPAAK